MTQTLARPSDWTKRPVEEANLLNPAFVALLIRQAADNHTKYEGLSLPWVLAYLVVPVALFAPARTALPGNTNTPMAAWTERHPDLRLMVARHAPALTPVVREAMLIGMRHNMLSLIDGRIVAGTLRRRVRGTPWRDPTDDFQSCTQKAAMLGRWFSRAGSPATILALWGLRP